MCRTVCLKIFITLNRLWNDQRGASAIEYAVIAALIAVGLITSLGDVQGALKDVFEHLGETLEGSTES